MNTRALRTVGEHRYYVISAISIVIVVLAGFSIDIPLLSHLGSLSVLVRAHGLIMLTWVALFFTQALLVARHRVHLHMRLGIFGAVLAIVVVVADAATLITACRLGGNHAVFGIWTVQFVYVRCARRRGARLAGAAQRLAQAPNAAGRPPAVGRRAGALHRCLYAVDSRFIDRAQSVSSRLRCG